MSELLKTKLKRQVLTIGSWITFGHTSIAEIMAKGGFDWLTVDMEHSAITLSEAQKLIQIIELAGIAPLVRVGENDACLIKRVMDAGAHGVIVPMVNSREEAIKAVDAVKYPPAGRRGVGLARAQGYGLEFEKYKKRINKESIVVTQIESIEAIDNLKEILEVEGVDASIIGPYDLSASLGYPGEFERKEVKEAIKRYIRVCKELKKSAGLHVVPPVAKKLDDAIEKGFKFIGFGFDALFLGQKIKEELEKIKR
ncbi:MAG: aldolase/citrate lyase family protein [Candidatus Omnitrophota bacterium]